MSESENPVVAAVERRADEMQLTRDELETALWFMIGYSPGVASSALAHIQRKRAERTGPPEPPAAAENGDLLAKITTAQRQVLLGVARGQFNKEIGKEMWISEDTVKTHLRRAMAKLGAVNRAHAVTRAFQIGLFYISRCPACGAPHGALGERLVDTENPPADRT